MMLRKCLITLWAALIAAPLAALDLDQMNADERAAFDAAVREYLINNPEVIVEAMQVLEARQSEAQAQADTQLVARHRQALFDDGFSYVGGNPDGDITLIEFMDYRCGYCKRAAPEVEKLLATDGGIRLVVKEFPILGEQSMQASRFAIATRQIAGPDAYKSVHDALIAFNGDISLPALMRIANGFGFDAEAIAKAMDSDAVSREIAATRALAQQLQISGTPTFVMHDELLRGYLPYDQLLNIVAEKRG